MPTLTTQDGLLAAVCALPNDDGPRLAYADWLDEHGDPHGEFIRVQLALAAHAAAASTRGTAFPPPPVPAGFLASTQVAALRRRERQLMALYDASWFGGLLQMPRQRYRQGEPRITFYPGHDEEIDFLIERGFPARVTCTGAVWCGGPCGRCGEALRCPACRGTGRTPAHGPALVRAAPVTEVRLSDRQPHGGPGAWWWEWGIRADDPGEIPSQLRGGLWLQKTYSIRASALAALSAACVAWARAQAGLPALDTAAAPEPQ